MDADPMGCYLGHHTYLSGTCVYCDRKDHATETAPTATNTLDPPSAGTFNFD